MMPSRAAKAVLLSLALAAHALASPAPGRFAVRAGDSTVAFTILKWSVFKEQGRFRDVSGTIAVDFARPELSRVDFAVETGSLDSGLTGRDEVVKSDDFLDVKRFPRMTFASTGVSRRDRDTFDVTGAFTLKGVTRTLTVPVKFIGVGPGSGDGEMIGFESTFSIDRTDFGVNGSRWSGGQLLLGKEVEVHLLISAKR